MPSRSQKQDPDPGEEEKLEESLGATGINMATEATSAQTALRDATGWGQKSLSSSTSWMAAAEKDKPAKQTEKTDGKGGDDTAGKTKGCEARSPKVCLWSPHHGCSYRPRFR